MEPRQNESCLEQQQVIAALHRRAVEIITNQDDTNREYSDEVDVANILLSAEPYQAN